MQPKHRTETAERSNEVKMNNPLTGVNISTRTILNPQKHGDKKGFTDNDGKWVIPPTYEDVDVFREGVCWVKAGDKWGLINEDGETLIDPRYDDIREFNEGFGNVKIAGKWGVVDKTGNYIFEPQFDIMFHYHDGIAIVKSGMKYGYVNLRNKCIIPPIHDYVQSFSEGFAAVILNGRWGYIDCRGNYLAEPKYGFAHDFREGKGEVLYGGMVGEIDSNGNYHEVREADNYDYASVDYFYEYEHGNCSYGFIDESGTCIIRPKFERVNDFKNGCARVWIDGKEKVINTKGSYISVSNYIKDTEDDNWLDKIFNQDNKHDCEKYPDFKIIESDGMYGVVDCNGKCIIEPKYRKIIWNREEEVFTVQTEGRLLSEKEENDLFWDNIEGTRDYDEVFDSRWGILDKNGNTITEPLYKMSLDDLKFSQGLAIVKVAGKWGLIDRFGHLIVPPIYKHIQPKIQEGYIIVKTETGTWGVLNKNLRMAFEPINYRITSINNGKAIIEEGYRYGFVDCITGDLVKPRYDGIHSFHDGLAVVEIIDDLW